ncbi:hypothetical protein NEUTE1DRAFT_67946 [Neurospora tetrasperma FGSC 2508]|uniref:Uncharacterized protein n=1 Tax=Neurospora tetrasperma (strain FGSC 2508 / ATCC MYA-4615 / P0657) TaxID=510951 RepID=F8MSG1_NEUT8|nr:uncharacterized protein NEUTE1DRAFT_67946 [Neurospora tetrasperma FGSC 2508]EGO55901.1 hypothetical protein NEUTE1DRAFT_67946 [Neurospora tetrasperma FGSC 2508]EGZ68841.1 hypothetical protein NEUTE2DRAFT_93367 [Neurospora tetrasperma FGSC 2509]
MVATTSSSMESASQVNNLPTTPAAAVISEQPKPNTMLPLPTTTTNNTNNLNQLDIQEEQEMGVGLRGGWMTIGKHFNCCGLNCGFSKTF